MHDGALYHALETQRRLSVHIVSARYLWCIVFYEVGQRFTQVLNIGRAGS